MAAACPITVYRTDGPGFPASNEYPEGASKTFLAGVPVFLSSGYVAEVTDGFTGTEIVLGISASKGQNLTAAGTEETPNEYGAPVGMTSAVVHAHGSPIKSGNTNVYHANGSTEFRAALVDGQTFSQALVLPGTRYELSRTANSYWAVDSTDTGTGADHAVEIVGADPNSTEHVIFRFTATKRVFD